MPLDPGLLFRAISLAALLVVPAVAWRARGRTYAIFGFVILAFSLPGAWITEAHLQRWLPEPWRAMALAAFVWGMAAAGLHLLHLVRARLRGRLFRVLVSVPGQTFIAASFMAGPWQLLLWPLRGALAAAGLDAWMTAAQWLDGVPYGVGAVSVATSTRRVTEWVGIHLGGDGPESLTRVPVRRERRPPRSKDRPLRVLQITDPHLGPWQSIRRLRASIASLLEHDPDLVLLTGDFLTMEGNGSRGALAEALAPLHAHAGRSFAIFGNHDHEAPDEVRGALEASGVTLLLDAEACVTTATGPVQVLGADYVRRERQQHLAGLFARHPRRPDHLRLLMLHDPSAFHHVPPGEVDLTLSGHTHGGQVGLLSLGLDWTVLSRSRWPDHGLFARGTSRLYVHRGTGFYGFPLRVGVPGEASILELHPTPDN
jgi:predicted MPP superfamily phosphohydrolase